MDKSYESAILLIGPGVSLGMPGIDSSIMGRPQVAFLFEEMDPTSSKRYGNVLATAGVNAMDLSRGVFVFQYWPTQIQDNYESEWVTKPIPGASHPLYQWVGGAGRTISFEALFTAEVEDTGLPSLLLPSARYTVDVAGAIASLRRLQHPDYGDGAGDGAKKGLAKAPPRLRLCFPGSNLGANTDGILCFLKSARVLTESSFASGKPRVATVSLEFIETVQNVASGEKSSNIQYIGSSSFKEAASNYKFTSP